MRIGFPVIFIRNGVEYAGVVCSSSPRRDQVPLEDLNSPLTRDQRFNELRCSIVFWSTTLLRWDQADNVRYLPIDLPIPAEGDYYSEVGAPDPGERLELKEAQAKHAAQMEEGRRAFEALPEEEKAKFRAANVANSVGREFIAGAQAAASELTRADLDAAGGTTTAAPGPPGSPIAARARELEDADDMALDGRPDLQELAAAERAATPAEILEDAPPSFVELALKEAREDDMVTLDNARSVTAADLALEESISEGLMEDEGAPSRSVEPHADPELASIRSDSELNGGRR